MKKILFTLIFSIVAAISLSACSNTDDRIAKAQSRYRELVKVHNEAIAAYDEIQDNSLDDEFKALSLEIEKTKDYNLYEMKPEEIDSLIGTMETLEAAYQGYIDHINETKLAQEAAVLKDRSFTLRNETGKEICSLSLAAQDEDTQGVDAIESLSGIGSGQEIAGLTVYFDVDDTPWNMYVSVPGEGEDETLTYTIELSIDILGITDKELVLTYDEETDTMAVQ